LVGEEGDGVGGGNSKVDVDGRDDVCTVEDEREVPPVRDGGCGCGDSGRCSDGVADSADAKEKGVGAVSERTEAGATDPESGRLEADAVLRGAK
jgi:hypothetical protein